MVKNTQQADNFSETVIGPTQRLYANDLFSSSQIHGSRNKNFLKVPLLDFISELSLFLHTYLLLLEEIGSQEKPLDELL